MSDAWEHVNPAQDQRMQTFAEATQAGAARIVPAAIRPQQQTGPESTNKHTTISFRKKLNLWLFLIALHARTRRKVFLGHLPWLTADLTI
jgi:hypothetical protein